MIVNDKGAVSRLDSPLNLINKLKNGIRKNNAMSLFIPAPAERKDVKHEEVKVTLSFNPFETKDIEIKNNNIEPNNQPTTIDDISDDHDGKIELALAHDNALKLLNASVSTLSAKLDDVKADKLPAVIAAASRTVESIRKERNEASRNANGRDVHYHFYTPTQRKLEEFEVIEVSQ